MQSYQMSYQVPLLVRKCLQALIHLNSKSSRHPLLGLSVPSRPPPSRGLLFLSLSDEVSESVEESLDESELVVSEESLHELESSDESVSALLDFFRLSFFRRFYCLFALFSAFAFAFFFLFSFTLPSIFGIVLQESSAILIQFQDNVPYLLCDHTHGHLLCIVCCDDLHHSGQLAYPLWSPRSFLDTTHIVLVQAQWFLLLGEQFHTGCHPIFIHWRIRPASHVLGRGRSCSFITTRSHDLLLRRPAAGVHNLRSHDLLLRRPTAGVHNLSVPHLRPTMGPWTASSSVRTLHLLALA